MSMLPAECPTIDGFEIAAHSVQAREVGGDFYDFIEMEEEKLGMVIGDVTGKSVSGALVMSASRSVLRMLAEENFSVGEVMTRANRRIKKDGITSLRIPERLSWCSLRETPSLWGFWMMWITKRLISRWRPATGLSCIQTALWKP